MQADSRRWNSRSRSRRPSLPEPTGCIGTTESLGQTGMEAQIRTAPQSRETNSRMLRVIHEAIVPPGPVLMVRTTGRAHVVPSRRGNTPTVTVVTE